VRQLESEHTVVLKGQKRQIARSISTSIDVYSVRSYVWLLDGGVAVDDVFSEVPIAFEKFFTDPEHVLLLLSCQGDARLDARMHEKEIAAYEARAQAPQKVLLTDRNCLR